MRLPWGVAGAVLGVLGGSGGVGASTFAAVLALCAGRAVLVDLDFGGGGIDVLLGIETSAGARWSGLRLGGGRLDPRALADGLPCWRGIPVLAADTEPASPAAATTVLDAARALGTVVLALPRAPAPTRDAALAACLLTVLVIRGDVCGVAAATAVASGVGGDVRLAAVVRAGELSGAEAAALVGLPLLGVLRGRTRRPGAGRPARPLLRVARGIVRGAT